MKDECTSLLRILKTPSEMFAVLYDGVLMMGDER